MRTTLPVFVGLGVCVLLAPTGSFGASDSCEPEVDLTGVGARPQPGLPLEITDVSHFSNIVERETTLRYVVTNHASDPVTQVRLLVLLFDSSGRVRGGQRFREKVSIAPGAQEQRTVQLSNLLYVDPSSYYVRFAVAVEEAQTGREVWKQPLPLPELVAAMEVDDQIPLERTASGLEGPGICLECKEPALRLCGRGCVQAFSCKQREGTCVFQCQPSCTSSW